MQKEIELYGDLQSVARRKVARRPIALNRFLTPLFACLVLSTCMVLSSCTASGPLQSPNMASVLTPSQSETDSGTAPSIASAPDSAPAASRPNGVPKPRPSKDEPAPEVKNALVPVSKPVAPAEKAANQLAAGSPGSEATVEKVETAAKTDSEAEPTAKTKKGGSSFFANLFQKPQSSTTTKRTGVKQGATVKRSSRKRSARSLFSFNRSSLPGVRGDEIYGIDMDEADGMSDGIRLASVTNRARRGSHGLLLQREGVKVGCFPPELVRLLKRVERKFGRTPIVTSGYRTRKHNRMIRGARNSMHIHCKAADIQVQGVSKSRLAKYLRSLPGRGGVGTYCHTKSVHLDVGRKRDWNRRCRRRRARKT